MCFYDFIFFFSSFILNGNFIHRKNGLSKHILNVARTAAGDKKNENMGDEQCPKEESESSQNPESGIIWGRHRRRKAKHGLIKTMKIS